MLKDLANMYNLTVTRYLSLMIKAADLLILLLCFIAYDNAYSTSIIRDSEVEAVVKELAQPLFAAAGIDSKQIKIFIINDNSINAYVVNNNSIFINLGLLQYSTEPYILLGLLAHEIAHISAGHILQVSNAMDHFKSFTMISYMLGLVSSIVINPQITNAILVGGVTLSTSLFSSYSQKQESVADSYALKYLDEAGYNNIGIKEVFNYFKSIEPENAERYFRTHPLSDKRLFAIQNYKVKNNVRQVPIEQLLRFKRIVIKLDSFFTPIHVVSGKYIGVKKDNDKTYIDAIIYYRQGKIEDAIMQIDSLIQDDPYLYEFKAEMLYKAGRLDEAIENYEKSLRYLSESDSYLVKLALSHTLLLYGDVKKAIFYLEQIVNIEPNDAFIWKYLSIAYRSNSNMAMCYFALTKKAFIEDDLKQFMKYSKLAVNTLPKDSTYLSQVEDMKQCKRGKNFSENKMPIIMRKSKVYWN